jgi:chromosome segregation ATPase
MIKWVEVDMDSVDIVERLNLLQAYLDEEKTKTDDLQKNYEKVIVENKDLEDMVFKLENEKEALLNEIERLREKHAVASKKVDSILEYIDLLPGNLPNETTAVEARKEIEDREEISDNDDETQEEGHV